MTWWVKGMSAEAFMLPEPVPATPLPPDPRVLVEQAREKAAWWRAELVAGRLPITRHTLEGLLRDLEMAGGTGTARS